MGKINRYEYIAGEEISSLAHKKLTQEARYNYSPIGKAFEKLEKTIKDQGKNKSNLCNIWIHLINKHNK